LRTVIAGLFSEWRLDLRRLSLNEPDWKRLLEIGDEVASLQDAGKWTREAFDRLVLEAEAATNGHGEFAKFVVNAAEPGWLGQGGRQSQCVPSLHKS
jgi:hypothetical protein